VVTKKQLTDLELKWREVLFERQPFDMVMAGKIARRRYELNQSEYPPLTDVEKGRREMLLEALGAYDLLRDVENMRSAAGKEEAGCNPS
jgi:hypothetical protein